MYFAFVFDQGPSGFDDLRKYIKQGNDFCRDVAGVLHERWVTIIASLSMGFCEYMYFTFMFHGLLSLSSGRSRVPLAEIYDEIQLEQTNQANLQGCGQQCNTWPMTLSSLWYSNIRTDLNPEDFSRKYYCKTYCNFFEILCQSWSWWLCRLVNWWYTVHENLQLENLTINLVKTSHYWGQGGFISDVFVILKQHLN